jgi:organic hydroperoxide reductase OsmC/OhrA
MSKHRAEIAWRRKADERFTDSKYSRAHEWKFDGGVIVPASSAVSSVPSPFSKPENVDPEEALVAAISSCHMLTFLYRAAKSGFVVDSYDDCAIGTMALDSRGRQSITAVKLEPNISFSGSVQPSSDAVARLHHEAHEECFIANSVRSEISVDGTWRYLPA